MAGLSQAILELRELVRAFRQWRDDPQRAEDAAAMSVLFERFADQYTERAGMYAESAAWCRLVVGVLRGEDVPDSIH
jgi:hypothetical protein